MASASPWVKYVVFLLIYTAYAVCYFARRNAAFWSGAGVRTGFLTHADVGAFTTAFEAASGVAKVASGFIVDTSSPTRVMVVSLLVIGASNGLWLAAPYPALRTALWALNGAAQAFVWPALARIFMSWFTRPQERGWWYSVLATSQNAGAALAPFVLAMPVAAYGWQAALLVPAGVAILCAVLCAAFLRDAPQLEPHYDSAKKPREGSQSPKPATATASSRVTVSQTVLLIVTSPVLWLLGVSYFFNSFVRSVFTDWVALLAAEVPMQPGSAGPSGAAAQDSLVAKAVSMYEVGGAIGGLLSGIVSDRVFHGRRGPVMALFGIVLAPLPLLVFGLSHSSSTALLRDAMPLEHVYFLVGLCGFAPHVLNGLAAREFAAVEIASSAGGFTKALGQLGGAVAGYPVSMLAGTAGWQYVMSLTAACGLLSGVSVLPLWWQDSGATGLRVCAPTQGTQTPPSSQTAASNVLSAVPVSNGNGQGRRRTTAAKNVT